MTSSKLSDSEKQEIVRLYQDVPEETTITLAERFGVSSSTVRRILQSAIPKDIYDVLTHQKQRLHRTIKKSGRKDSTNQVTPAASKQTGGSDDSTSDPDLAGGKRRRRRTATADPSGGEKGEESNLLESNNPKPIPKKSFSAQNENDEIEELIPGELFPQEEFSDFDDDEDYGESEADEEYDGDLFDPPLSHDTSSLVKILPLTEASLPKICYLVIDRGSELIVKPLKAFSELGRIPSEEIQEKTLPVFENHRVASRFSARNQRVFKVPDGRLLQKTAPYLQAKGITRLLIDGQVYRF